MLSSLVIYMQKNTEMWMSTWKKNNLYFVMYKNFINNHYGTSVINKNALQFRSSAVSTTTFLPFLGQRSENWHLRTRLSHRSGRPIRDESRNTWPAWFWSGTHAHACPARSSGVVGSLETLDRPDLDPHPPPHSLQCIHICIHAMHTINLIQIKKMEH